ncbi:hypothetical protein ENU1_067070 [Entamoeba nuttalli P19]|uniref:Uncharacterized protein n=2 Tax=Entamoeba nuttalli TaxID=412467 RepID=K2H0X3_ENTNP|nr:hypothetical protein ENU1_067070 [Entamoeba nuttalli P19]EKE41128.1 hypothetical protein ENU1_067070 [Entamoeba nuttalli P19]|eukprot:XP_008856537.1 hypothetical protein ENU1_067070 [Entamoeba nuttalli P19]
MQIKVFLLFVFIIFASAIAEDEFELNDKMTINERMAQVWQIRNNYKHNFLKKHFRRRIPPKFIRKVRHHHCGICGCAALFTTVDRAADEIDYISQSIHKMIEREESPSKCSQCNKGKCEWEAELRRKMSPYSHCEKIGFSKCQGKAITKKLIKKRVDFSKQLDGIMKFTMKEKI